MLRERFNDKIKICKDKTMDLTTRKCLPKLIARKSKALSLLLCTLSVIAASGCSQSPKSVLKTYLDAPVDSKRRYDTICEKEYVSQEDLKEYYASPANSGNSKWKTTNIEHVKTVEDKNFIDAEHIVDGEKSTAQYIVIKRENGDPCVSWTNDGRFFMPGTHLIRYPESKITIYANVKLSDYYNYDFSDKQSTHMALEIIDAPDSWNWKTIYIPYAGNEDLYDYLSKDPSPQIKGVVSREYDDSLRSEAVKEYNDVLKKVQETIYSYDPNSDYEPDFIPYDNSFITEDESILFMPTAIPVEVK